MTVAFSPTRYFPSLTPRTAHTFSYSSAMQVDERSNDNEDEDDLITLNAKIAALQSQLAVLQTKRHALIQKHILRALTPPSDGKPSLPLVTRLAPELWSFIFELALETDASYTSSVPSNANLLSISAVCKRWRSIAHSTPRLWTNIVVTAPNKSSVLLSSSSWSPSDSISNFLTLLMKWIPRSGGLPFHLYILDPYANNHTRKLEIPADRVSLYTRDDLLQQTIWTLYDHLDRCHSIRVDEGMTDIWTVLFSGLRSISLPLVAPNLHTALISYVTTASRIVSTPAKFSWTAPPSASVLHPLDLTSAKLQLPSLHTLDVTSPTGVSTLNGFSLDYSQLRVLKWRFRGSFYGPPGFTAFTDLLAKCTHLEECEVDRLPMAGRHPPLNTITLPYLKRLEIKFTLSDDPGLLLSIIHAPGLQELALEQTSPISHVLGLSGAIAEFLRANTTTDISISSQGLRSLILTGLILKEPDAPLFQALDNVQPSCTDLELTFNRCFLHDSFVLQMLGIQSPAEPMTGVANAMQSVPLSRLTNLTFHSTSCNYRLLNDAIQDRDGLRVRID